MAGGRFVARADLAGFEWDSVRGEWKRPALAWLLFLLAVPAATAIAAFRLVNPWLALVPLYCYWFVCGFWVCIGHELQHTIVFGEKAGCGEWIPRRTGRTLSRRSGCARTSPGSSCR